MSGLGNPNSRYFAIARYLVRTVPASVSPQQCSVTRSSTIYREGSIGASRFFRDHMKERSVTAVTADAVRGAADEVTGYLGHASPAPGGSDGRFNLWICLIQAAAG